MAHRIHGAGGIQSLRSGNSSGGSAGADHPVWKLFMYTLSQARVMEAERHVELRNMFMGENLASRSISKWPTSRILFRKAQGRMAANSGLCSSTNKAIELTSVSLSHSVQVLHLSRMPARAKVTMHLFQMHDGDDVARADTNVTMCSRSLRVCNTENRRSTQRLALQHNTSNTMSIHVMFVIGSIEVVKEEMQKHVAFEEQMDIFLIHTFVD